MDKVESFNFLKYADDYGIEYTTHAGNLSKGWLLAMDCVFCGHHNGKHHLGIPNEGNRSFCWSCGSHSLYETLKAITPSVNYYTLLETYAGWIDDRALLKKKKVTHVESVPFEFDPLGKVARKYLKKRGFDPDILQDKYKFRDGGCIGDYKYRVIIPIIYNGAVVSYQGRSYNPAVEPKYRFLPEEKCAMNPKHIFFNLDNARGDHVICVEGVFDAIKLAGEDCKDVIASLGISTTEEQVQLLAKRFKKVSICNDPEPVAIERARKMAVKLSALGVEAEVIDTERDYDLGDSSAEECNTLKEEILG
jgi:hypothetical protein